MFITSFLLFLIAVIILVAVGIRSWLRNYIKCLQTYRHIPCPPRTLPLLGNLHQIPLNSYQFSLTLCELYELTKNMGFCCVWLATHPVILLFRPVGLDILFGSSKNITKASEYKFLEPWLRTGLLTSTGTKWKTRRHIITPAFHQRTLLHSFVDIFNRQSNVLIERLLSLYNEKPKQKVNLYPYITSCSLDIICEAAMGLNVEVQKKNSQYADAVHKITDIILKRQRMPWMWPDWIFKWLPAGREHDRYLKILHQFTEKVIQDRARTFHTNENQEKHSAFLDILLKQMDSERLTLLDVQEEVDSFMFEGHDTTAAAINFTCFMIASHQEVQQKLHEEIDRIFGSDHDRPCTMEDLNELNYLNCVIKETMRMYPSVPMIAREIQEDFVHNGYKILRGTTAVICIYFIHRDPNYFPDPERFDPDRFLPENKINRPSYAYIPFSAGVRNCIGQRFAMLEQKTVLSSILRRFKLKTLQTQTDLQLCFELILRSQSGAFVQIEPRY